MLGFSKKCLLLVLALMMAQNAFADSLFFALETGRATPKADNFKSELAPHYVVGYDFNVIAVELGVYNSLEFEQISRQPYLESSLIEQNAYDFLAFYRFKWSIIEFEVGAGAILWEQDAIFNGTKVGHDSGTSLVVDLRAGKKFGNHFKLYLTGKRLSSISGSDIDSLGIGIRYIF